MPNLSDKLRSLGVQVGAKDLAPPKRSGKAGSLEKALAGHALETSQGETFVIEALYPLGYQHGNRELVIDSPLGQLATWAKETGIQNLPQGSFAFLDTETTGLAGGAGTYAFLIGVGRFDEQGFQLAQFFLRDPIEEPAQLAALESFLAPCQAVVTFNGKTFDIPLLQTRYISHGWRSPFAEMAHIDLLHLSRRLWSERLPSRTLLNLEAQILDVARGEEDVPGWMIPSLYFQYLRDGDPQPLVSVLYHNAMDIVTLAALMDHAAGILDDPLEHGSRHGVDLIALAKLYEDMGDLERATNLYLHGLDHPDAHHGELPKTVLLKALTRLAMIYKRQGNYPAAVHLWEEAAGHGDIEVHVELAKYYEHQVKAYDQAIYWTQKALDILEQPLSKALSGRTYLAYQQREKRQEMEHRLARLTRKAATDQ